PPVVDIGDARQVMLLLLFIAEGIDHGTDHADAEGERRRRRIHLQFLVEDVVLHRAPSRAAIFLRPVRHAPALLVQDAPPGDHLVFAEMTALDQLSPGLGRYVVAEKCPHFLANAISSLLKARSIGSSCELSKTSSLTRRVVALVASIAADAVHDATICRPACAAIRRQTQVPREAHACRACRRGSRAIHPA